MNNPKFQIFKGKNDQYYFRLKARNGEVILSSEGYLTKAACENGIWSVKSNSEIASKFKKAVSATGKYYFILTAANGQNIGRSELYNSIAARDNGISAVKLNASLAPVEDSC